MVFTLLAALALKVKLDGETLEDKMWFVVILVGLKFAGPIALIIKQFLDGGMKNVAKENTPIGPRIEVQREHG